VFERDALRHNFLKLYGTKARLFRAPGRVNLIGEHTDYNDGFVLPVAINRETVVAAAVRADSLVRAFSLDLNETAEFNLNAQRRARRGIWLDYVEGVARVLQSRGLTLHGADLLIQSDVPMGAGLSSSAALEVSVGLALSSLSGIEIDRTVLALAAQEAEHKFIGTKCGIMDQLIATLGRRGHALLIDCRSLETTQIPLETSRMVIAICDTRVKHDLASSEYNVRRAECERGVELLREALPGIRALRDVSIADFQKYEGRLPEPVKQRCRHVVTENARTLAAAEALRDGRMDEVGRLMFLSHQSLRDDYQVSSEELDLLVEIAARVPGTFGARMTGGGFGGCTVNLLRREALDQFRETVLQEYSRAMNFRPAIYVTEASDGANELES
jgi:galactokinase